MSSPDFGRGSRRLLQTVAVALLAALLTACESPSPDAPDETNQRREHSGPPAPRKPQQTPQSEPTPALAGIPREYSAGYATDRGLLVREMTEDAVERAARLDKMARYLVSDPSDDAVASVRQALLDVEATVFPLLPVGKPDPAALEPAWGRLRTEQLPADFPKTEFQAEIDGKEDTAHGIPDPDADTWNAPAGLGALDRLLSGADASAFGSRHGKISPAQAHRSDWLTALTGRLLRDLRALHSYRKEKTAPQAVADPSTEELTAQVTKMLDAMAEASRPALAGGPASGRRLRYAQRGVRALWTGDFTRDDNSTAEHRGLRSLLARVDGAPVEAVDVALERARDELQVYPTHREAVRLLKGGPDEITEDVRTALKDVRRRLEATRAVVAPE